MVLGGTLEFGSKCLRGQQRWNPRGLSGPEERQLPGNQVSPSFFRMTSRPLCFQMMVGGRELTTSHTITASSPSLNSWGVGAFLNMSFSGKWARKERGKQLVFPWRSLSTGAKLPGFQLQATLKIYIYICIERVPPSTWSKMPGGAAGTSRGIFCRSLAINVYHWVLNLSHFVHETSVEGKKGLYQGPLPCGIVSLRQCISRMNW